MSKASYKEQVLAIGNGTILETYNNCSELKASMNE